MIEEHQLWCFTENFVHFWINVSECEIKSFANYYWNKILTKIVNRKKIFTQISVGPKTIGSDLLAS